MQILAIDTTTNACSVALWKDHTICAHFEKCPLEKYTQNILLLVKTTLNKNNISLKDLNAIAFSQGPGSFTGVRIGISVVQGLALGAELPIVGVSKLATMAQSAWRKTGINKILVIINACLNQMYWAEYTRDIHGFWCGKETEAILKTSAVIQRIKQLSGKWAIAGIGWQSRPEIANYAMLNLIDSNVLISEAKDMLPIAYNLLLTGHSTSVEYAEPIYLCNENIWKKLPGKN